MRASRQDEHAVGLAVEVIRPGPGQCGSVETRAGERVLGDKMNRTGVAWLLCDEFDGHGCCSFDVGENRFLTVR